MNREKGSRILLLTFYQLMTWFPDGKICRAHKSYQIRKCTGLWKWGRREFFVETAEWDTAEYMPPFHVQFLSFIPSFLLLFITLFFFTTLSPHLPRIQLPYLISSHLLEKKRGSSFFSCPEVVSWIPCADLYVLVNYITVWDFKVIWLAVEGNSGQLLRMDLPVYGLDILDLNVHRLICIKKLLATAIPNSKSKIRGWWMKEKVIIELPFLQSEKFQRSQTVVKRW